MISTISAKSVTMLGEPAKTGGNYGGPAGPAIKNTIAKMAAAKMARRVR
jgi:hypothetical protein